jgi:hypothetical protein
MRALLLSAAFVLSAALASVTIGAALAQEPTFDPDQLPVFHGVVAMYSLLQSDQLDGIILDDGTEVRISPRLSAEVAFAVKPGDTVTVHGLKVSGAPVVQAMSIVNNATGARVLDTFQPAGPPYENRRVQLMEAKGHVKAQLYGGDGKVDGVLLADGTIIRLTQGFMPANTDCLTPGRDIVATGFGLVSLLGRVLDARSVTLESKTGGGPVPIYPRYGMRPDQNLPLLNPPTAKPVSGSPTSHN